MAKKAPTKRKVKKGQPEAPLVTPPVTETAPVAVPENQRVAAEPQLPVPVAPITSAVATFGNMEAIAGYGLEDTTADDYAIPFLRILQPLSPQVVDKTVEGAEAGDIIETATDELYTEVDLIPCVYQRRFVEWKPREMGGGFIGMHEAGSPVVESAVRQGNKDVLKNGNELQNTAQFYCLLKTDSGEWVPVVIPMASTQLKRARRWLSMMSGQKMDGSKGSFTPPIFAYSYTLKTASESNNAGTWWSWDIGKSQDVSSEELFNQAFAFAKSVKGGKVAPQGGVGDTENRVEAGFKPEGTPSKDDIPF